MKQGDHPVRLERGSLMREGQASHHHTRRLRPTLGEAAGMVHPPPCEGARKRGNSNNTHAHAYVHKATSATLQNAHWNCQNAAAAAAAA